MVFYYKGFSSQFICNNKWEAAPQLSHLTRYGLVGPVDRL